MPSVIDPNGRSKPDAPRVVFFDLDGLLVRVAGRAPGLRPAARRWLDGRTRVGILANAPRALGRSGVEQTLVALGLDGSVEPALIVDAAALRTALPDRRAFAVAAAIAEEPADRCLFVTTSRALASAARRAGMAATVLGATALGTPGRPATTGRPATPAAAFDAAEAMAPGEAVATPAGLIDPDAGPTFVLRGRIVTMARSGVIDGYLGVRAGRIAAIECVRADLPAPLRAAPLIETGGTIYPGLIDLHNHYVYDIAPLWRVPKPYDNRTDWADVESKKAEVSLPVKLLATWPATAKAIARYVEAKALIGGTTSGQGLKTPVRGGYTLFRGAMRNIEAADDPRLPDSATLVPTLGRRPEDFAAFRATLEKRARLGGSYFYHLAEGTDALSRRTFTDLRDNGLLLPPLVGIHALALGFDDLRALAQARSKVVWSPFSNLLLYGQTLELARLVRSRVRFAIGCDWTPSGSRNLLEELKVARYVVRAQGAALDDEALVRAVTVRAAELTGWSKHLGRIRPGGLADLLVIRGVDGEPYGQLIDATEPDVRLVVVHGTPRYGDRTLMESLRSDPGLDLEPWSAGGVDKAFQLASPASPINGLTLASAVDELTTALGDLHGFKALVETGFDHFRALGVEPAEVFSLVLDNESPDGGDAGFGDVAFGEASLTDWSPLPASLELDDLVVGGSSYWDRLRDQTNLDPDVTAMLRAAYPA